MHGAISSQKKPGGLIKQIQKNSLSLGTSMSTGPVSLTFATAPKTGNLLVMFLSVAAGVTVFTPPTGWTQLMFMDSLGNVSPPGTNRTLSAAYKVAAVGESSTVSCSITTGAAVSGDMQIFEYAGASVLDVSFTKRVASNTSITVGPTSANAEAIELALAAVGISNRPGQSFSNGYARENGDTSRAMVGSKTLSLIEAQSTIASWTTATDPVSGLFTFRPWRPTDIAGLAGWWDATDLSTITVATGVSAWADKSGNTRTFSQATAANQPKTGTRTINGLNVLDFDGSNDVMNTPAWTRAYPYTVFVVFQNRSGANGAQQRLINSSVASTIELQKNSANQWEIFISSAIQKGPVDTSAHYSTSIMNGASSELRIDGVGVTGSPGSTTPAGVVRIGASPTPNQYWNGTIGEIIWYPTALSAADVASVEAYLRRKWVEA